MVKQRAGGFRRMMVAAAGSALLFLPACLGMLMPATRDPNLTPQAVQALDLYQQQYAGNSVTELGWNGSVRRGKPGTLPQAVLDRMLLRINYLRRLAGLPGVRFTERYNRLAQHAAFLMLANKRLSHYPDSSWHWFSREARAGAAASNLGFDMLGGLITGFMEDLGDNNTHCGHRRWILFSGNSEFGFGAAHDPSWYYFAAEALHVTAGKPPVGAVLPAFIAWPPAGYVPTPLVFARASFSLPLPAADVDLSAARVTMRSGGGEVIPVRRFPLQRVGDPGITWEILPAASNIHAFRKKWNNKSITIRIEGIVVNEQNRVWEYSFTPVVP